MGLSGLGDLLLTCTGPASRNYSLGLALGRGERLADVLAGAQRGHRGRRHCPCPGRACREGWICRSAPQSQRCWPDA